MIPVTSGRELARGDRHHGLVEEREALLDAARLDEHAAAGVAGEGSTVGVAEALGDHFSLRRRRGRTGEVSGRFELEDARREQVATLDAVHRLALE